MKNTLLLLAKIDYQKNRKKLILIFSMLFLFLFAAYLKSGNFDVGKDMLLASMNCIPAVTLLLYVLLSLSFRDYHGKGAILTIMLPIRNREKFAYVIIRNLVFIPLTILLIYYINHSFWELIFEKDYHLLMKHGSLYKINTITNFLIFFLSGILFRRLHVLYGLLMIVIIQIITFPFLTNQIGSILTVFFDPGIIPQTLSNYPYIGIVGIIINLGIIVWAWMKFKHLQIK